MNLQWLSLCTCVCYATHSQDMMEKVTGSPTDGSVPHAFVALQGRGDGRSVSKGWDKTEERSGSRVETHLLTPPLPPGPGMCRGDRKAQNLRRISRFSTQSDLHLKTPLNQRSTLRCHL